VRWRIGPADGLQRSLEPEGEPEWALGHLDRGPNAGPKRGDSTGVANTSRWHCQRSMTL
jgi:hypothetical protein